MSTTFVALNSNNHASEVRTPTTPTQQSSFPHHPAAEEPSADSSAPSTPTRHSFAGLSGQRPLPDEPFTSVSTPDKYRETTDDDPPTPAKTLTIEDDDVEMGDGDDTTTAADEDGSDNDSVTSESQRPSKKKKGQRFFCTDFPPCQLSFTRSEHLARHIRKHTGERPFQCHCSRRFSRLDNLRQHAQTVHVNEEIPGDSLAATSTRFQRQIRTDRVRPPGNRSRTSTMNSSQGSHGKSHTRNLSTSSIGSTASSAGFQDDTRRRPPPLAMANDGSKRAMDNYAATTTNNNNNNNNNNININTPDHLPQYPYYNQSPSGLSTPASQTFSVGTASSTYTSGFASPASTISRSSFYNGARHSRRLSVPSAQTPLQGPGGTTYNHVYYNPASSNVSNCSQNTSVFASPTSSIFSHGRRDSETEIEYRRRTWHPGSNSSYSQRPATSGLSYHQTPDEPRPALSQQPAASQVTRLPGIESFDHAPPTPVRQQTSPMMIDPLPRPPSSGRPLDAALHQGLNRLDITSSHPSPGESQWPQQPAQPSSQQSYFNPPPPPPPAPVAIPQQPVPHHLHHMSMPEPPITPRKNKRQAWYGGPVGPSQQPQQAFTTNRPSPEDSGSSDGAPTPLTFQGQEYHPVIVNHNDPNGPQPTVVEEPQQKVHQPHHPAAPFISHPPSQQLPHPAMLPPNNDDRKPTLPTRADSGFQNFIAQQNAGIAPPLPVQPSHDHPTYTLPVGQDPRFTNGYTQVRPEQNGGDMGRLEALVAVATSENRAVESRQ